MNLAYFYEGLELKKKVEAHHKKNILYQTQCGVPHIKLSGT